MSNIEEVIKILEKFNPGDEYTEKIKNAIENILSERKQDKARIQELEENNDLKIKNNFRIVGHYAEVKLEELLKEDYIPKQKVKEIVKEAIEIIESEQFKVIMGDMTKVGRLRWLLEKELLEDK